MKIDTTLQLLDTLQDTLCLSEELQLMGNLQGHLSWVLILVASAAVMQIVTIFVLLTSRRGGRGYRNMHDRRPGAPTGVDGRPDNKGQGGAPRRSDGGTGGQRKPGDGGKGGGGQRQGGQQGGRSQQERGGKPNQGSIDPVELSLRDINQRLKNAEREQDSARRNMRDGDGADGDGRGRDGRPQQRGGRDGRDGRGGNRDDKGPRRDSGRDGNRGRDGRPERQDRGDGARPPQEHGRFRQNEQGTDAPERPQAPEIIPNDTTIPDDQLQHGRRFTAKRRMLPDEAVVPEEAGRQQEQPSQIQESAPAFADNSDSFGGQERQEQGDTEDIQFGR